jgi:hypothetical protein
MNSRLPSAARLRLNQQQIKVEKQRRRCPFLTVFAEDGPFRREHYPKHMEFFRAGAQYNERLFMAANRVGKTVAGAFETTCHLTGRYPSWACGATTRDLVQGVVLGKSSGPGMIPTEAIVHSVAGRGITGSVRRSSRPDFSRLSDEEIELVHTLANKTRGRDNL